MLKNFFDRVLSVFVISSFMLFVAGNTARFVSWLQYRNSKKNIYPDYYLDFWGDEWGTECTKEEIEKLNQIIKQFEEEHG